MMNWDLAGHEWAVAQLQQHLLSHEVRHVYLFTGLPNIGRRTLALRLIQALNCPYPPHPGEPCRACRTCEQIEHLQYPDLEIVQAEGNSRDIKIDQIRALQHRLVLAPFSSAFRVALLLNFQDANLNAQNALLKTLEEAPERAILILTADTPEALLPTIVSRCEVMRLRPLGIEDAVQYLSTLPGMEPAQAHYLAHLSGGRIGYARFLFENPGEQDRLEAIAEQMLTLLVANRRMRFVYAEQLTREWGKSRDALAQAMQVWLSLWRDLLICAAGAEVPITNLKFEARLRNLAGLIEVSTAQQVVASIESSFSSLEGNANPRLLAEVLFLEMPRFQPVG